MPNEHGDDFMPSRQDRRQGTELDDLDLLDELEGLDVTDMGIDSTRDTDADDVDELVGY